MVKCNKTKVAAIFIMIAVTIAGAIGLCLEYRADVSLDNEKDNAQIMEMINNDFGQECISNVEIYNGEFVNLRDSLLSIDSSLGDDLCESTRVVFFDVKKDSTSYTNAIIFKTKPNLLKINVGDKLLTVKNTTRP